MPDLITESLRKVVFFYIAKEHVQRAELSLYMGQWTLDQQPLQKSTLSGIGRVELYAGAKPTPDDGVDVPVYVVEGLRSNAADAKFEQSGGQWQVQIELALPSLFAKREIGVMLTLQIDAQGGRCTASHPGNVPQPDRFPELFRETKEESSALLRLAEGLEWTNFPPELKPDASAVDPWLLVDAQHQVVTPVIRWKSGNTPIPASSLRLRGVNLTGRGLPSADRAAQIDLVNRKEDGYLRLSQQLAPRRRAALNLDQYVAETTWSLLIGPVSVTDFCALWNEALHQPLMTALARLRGSALSFLPRLRSKVQEASEPGGGYLVLDFEFDGAFGNDAPSRDHVREARLAGFRPTARSVGKPWFGADFLGDTLSADASLSTSDGKLRLQLNQSNNSRLDLGALSLTVADDLGAQLNLALSSPLGCGVRAVGPPPPLALRIELSGLALAHVAPGATDGVPDAARAEAESPLSATDRERQSLIDARGGGQVEDTLVIPLSNNVNNPTRATLSATEIYAPSRQRRLQMEIRANGDASLQSVLVLDASPLFIGEIAGIKLTPDGAVEEIANYSESELEGSKWEIAGISRNFTLRLPPQAVGEAAEKGMRFAQAVDRNQPIDYRFSAPATLKLHSSWFDQRFNEAPWNVRRVFGFPGQRAPGSGVVELDFELIYGLRTYFDAQASPYRVQLAELGARMGALPPELDLRELPSPADPRRPLVLDAARSLIKLRRRYAQRLALLESYNPATLPAAGKVTVATADFDVDHGLSFTLRDSAAMEHPLRPGAHWKLADDKTPPAGAKYLRGGAVWGFESNEIYREVLDPPRSDRGWLRQLRFSALGAYGEQRSVFANGKSSISGSALMGRLSSYVIERIGRIGCSWNRARHVIEYQRSVLPSRQFASDQELHPGRPLLRKVREYVEILEPRRATKTLGQTVPGARFVEQVDFQSRVIPVSGVWGRDLEHGWAIPLWDPVADPDIYPRPHVCVECAGSVDEPSVAARVAEPQRLVFYTSTRPEDGENTDTWAPVLGVDYDDVPIPDPRALLRRDLLPGAFATGNYVDGEATLPSEAAETLGMYRFTLPLEPQARPSNLVAGTNDARIAARIDNISFMRAAAVGGQAGDAGAVLLAAISGGNDAFARIVNGAHSALHLENPISRKACAVALADAAGLVKAAMDNEVNAAKAWLTKQDQKASELQRLTRIEFETRLLGSVLRELDDLNRVLKIYSGEAQRFAAQVCVQPQVKARDRAKSWLAELSHLASGVDGGALQQRFARGLAADIAQISTATSQAQRTLELQGQHLSAVLDANDSWEERRRLLLLLLAEFRARRAAVVPEAGHLIARMPKSALRTLLQETSQRLAQMEREITKAEDALAQRLADVVSTPEQVRQQLDDLLRRVSVGLDTWLKPLTDLDKKVDDMLSSIKFEHLVLTAWAQTLEADVLDAIDVAFDAGEQRCAILHDRIEVPFQKALKLVEYAKSQLRVPDAMRLLSSAFIALSGAPHELAARVNAALDHGNDELQALLRRLQADTLEAADEIAARLQRLAAPLEPAFDAIEGVLARWREAPSFRAPDETLRLVRALGEGPILPHMTVNRDRLAYVFDDYLAAIKTSPAAALIDRVGEDLKALGVRVPFDGLAEDLLPPALKHFDLNRLLPDFAGLRSFGGLFDGLKMPKLSEHGVRVRHGFDKEQQSAWLQADIDLTLDKRVNIFNMAGLSLGLRGGRMTGQARVAADLDGLRTERKWAQIKGDWELSFGGYTLVRFVDTPLRFDESGSLRFEVDARKIALDRALAWLEDVVKQFSDPESGFTLELLKNPQGAPAGMRAALELPLPPLGAGAVTVAGIILSAFFALEIDKPYPDSNESGFALTAGFGLGKPTQPFSLFIAFLGGGGYVSGSATYWPSLPRDRNFLAQVDLGIAVGAAASFFFGPVRGHVMVLVGVRASYRVVGKGGRLSAALTLLVTGNVSLYGLVTIGLTLYLELIYGADKSLRGDGYLSVSVRISRFFKIKYSAPIRYQIAKGGADSKRADDDYQNAAQARRKTRC